MGEQSRSLDLHEIVNLFPAGLIFGGMPSWCERSLSRNATPKISVPSGQSTRTSPMFGELQSD